MHRQIDAAFAWLFVPKEKRFAKMTGIKYLKISLFAYWPTRKLAYLKYMIIGFTCLNEMGAKGGSFTGRNDQFGKYQPDGSNFNSPPALAAATPGVLADTQPVNSQIRVNITTYDHSYSPAQCSHAGGKLRKLIVHVSLFHFFCLAETCRHLGALF